MFKSFDMRIFETFFLCHTLGFTVVKSVVRTITKGDSQENFIFLYFYFTYNNRHHTNNPIFLAGTFSFHVFLLDKR
jgi:hypothetical protein